MPRLLLATLLGVAVPLGLVRSEETTIHQLLPWVPAEVPLCITVENIPKHLKGLAQSPLFQQDVQPGGNQQSLQDLKALSTTLQTMVLKATGVKKIEELVDSLVIGYDARSDNAFFMLKSKNFEALRRFVERDAQERLKNKQISAITAGSYLNQDYIALHYEKNHDYLYFSEKVCVFTHSEEILKAIIGSSLSPVKTNYFSETRALAEHRQALFTLMIKPDWLAGEVLSAQNAETPPAKVHVLKKFSSLWKGCERLLLAVELKETLDIHLHLTTKKDQFPSEILQLLRRNSTRSLMALVPEESWFVLSGDTPLEEWFNVIMSFVSADETQKYRQELEKNILPIFGRKHVQDAVKMLGSNWICWLAPPRSGETKPRFTWAIELLPHSEQTRTRWQQALMAIAALLRLEHHKKHEDQVAVVIKAQEGTQRVSGEPSSSTFQIQLRGATAGLLQFQPIVALTDCYLILTTDEKDIALFRVKASKSNDKKENGDSGGQEKKSGHHLVARLNLKELGQSNIQQNQLFTFLGLLVGKNQARVEEELAEILPILKVCQKIEWWNVPTAQGIHWNIKIGFPRAVVSSKE